MNNIYDIVTNHINGSSFVGIDTVTKVKLKGGKKNLLQGRVTKRMTGASVMIFQNKNINGYDAMVKRRLVNEGKSAEDFTLSARSWGTRIVNTPFVEHKGQYYLEVIFLKAGNTEVLLDGEVVDSNTIEGYPVSSPAGKQGDLDNKVIIRTFKIDSITAIKVNKIRYEDLYLHIEETATV